MMTSPVLKEGSPESVGMDAARVERLKKLAAGWVEKGDTPTLAVLVARRGVVVLHEAYGVRRADDVSTTLKRDSVFTVASVAKPVTAAAVMCLVEDGLIGLNRPLIDYVPELEVPGVQWLEEARVADLLSHTAGFDDSKLSAFIEAAGKRTSDLPTADAGQHPKLGRLIRLAAGAPLAHQPGSTMLYSNFGYNLLGDIVRRVSGQPFWQFVRSRLFGPLGMTDSHYVLPPALRERRVYRAPGMPGTAPNPLYAGFDSPEYDELDLGSGGLASTARDLAVFLQMLLNGGRYGDRRVLSRASVAAMTRHQIDGSKVSGYGYGWFIFGPNDRFPRNGALVSPSAFGHSGYGSCYVWADPVQEVLGVYLSTSPRLHRGDYSSTVDLFQNAVHASVL